MCSCSIFSFDDFHMLHLQRKKEELPSLKIGGLDPSEHQEYKYLEKYSFH